MSKVSGRVMAAFGVVGLCVALCATTVGAQFGDRIWLAEGQTNAAIAAYDLAGNRLTSVSLTSGRPISVAVDTNGDAYFGHDFGSNITRVTAAGVVSSLAIPGTGYGVAFDSSGELVIAARTASTLTVYSMTTAGAIQSTLPLAATSSSCYVSVSVTGDVWTGTEDKVFKLQNGAAVLTINSSLSGMYGMATDPNGHCWVSYTSSPTSGVVRYNATTGQQDASISALSGATPGAVAVSALGDVYVTTRGQTVYRCDSSGSVLASTVLTRSVSGIALDGNGDLWIAVGSPFGFAKLDPSSLSVLETVDLGGAFHWFYGRGDATGYAHAVKLDRLGDFDADQVNNYTELLAGSNPFDALSTPTKPRPIVSGDSTNGQTVTIGMHQSSDALLGYAARCSLDNTVANYIPVPGRTETIPLVRDAFYDFARRNFWLFQGLDGFLDANGRGYAQLHLPSDSQLVGTEIYVAFITLDNNQSFPIETISNNVKVTIR